MAVVIEIMISSDREVWYLMPKYNARGTAEFEQTITDQKMAILALWSRRFKGMAKLSSLSTGNIV